MENFITLLKKSVKKAIFLIVKFIQMLCVLSVPLVISSQKILVRRTLTFPIVKSTLIVNLEDVPNVNLTIIFLIKSTLANRPPK